MRCVKMFGMLWDKNASDANFFRFAYAFAMIVFITGVVALYQNEIWSPEPLTPEQNACMQSRTDRFLETIRRVQDRAQKDALVTVLLFGDTGCI